MNFDQPQPSSAYPSSELVCSSVLIDLPTNKDFNELIKRKSEKMVFQKKQIRDGSSPNPVPMTCVLVLNNDGNESKKLKIKSDILWRNDGVPVIAADFGGNAFVKALSCVSSPSTDDLRVRNNDGNEKKLKIKSDILWRNDGVPVIAADFGGNAFVKALSCGR